MNNDTFLRETRHGFPLLTASNYEDAARLKMPLASGQHLLGWRTAVIPQNDSPEAFGQWLEFAVNQLQIAENWENVPGPVSKFDPRIWDFTEWVADAHKCVWGLVKQGWPNSIEETTGPLTPAAAGRELRRIHRWFAEIIRENVGPSDGGAGGCGALPGAEVAHLPGKKSTPSLPQNGGDPLFLARQFGEVGRQYHNPLIPKSSMTPIEYQYHQAGIRGELKQIVAKLAPILEANSIDSTPFWELSGNDFPMDRDADAVWDACWTACKRLQSKLQGPATVVTSTVVSEPDKAPYPSPSTYARDQWIYENIANNSCDTLSRKLKDKAKKEKWAIISSRNGFKKAADRFADYHSLPHRRFKSD